MRETDVPLRHGRPSRIVSKSSARGAQIAGSEAGAHPPLAGRANGKIRIEQFSPRDLYFSTSDAKALLTLEVGFVIARHDTTSIQGCRRQKRQPGREPERSECSGGCDETVVPDSATVRRSIEHASACRSRGTALTRGSLRAR